VESLKTRLSAYHKQTAPLADFYREKQILTTVDAAQQTGHVYTAIRQAFRDSKKKDFVKFV
jgi:adenylate kinase